MSSLDTMLSSIPDTSSSSSSIPGNDMMDAALKNAEQREQKLSEQAADTTGKMEEIRKEKSSVQIPALPDLKPAPKYEQSNDPARGYAATIGLLGAIGSMFSRTPMVNSMNAAAATLEAMKKGDMDTYNKNFETWKVENENAMKIHNYEMDTYKAIMDSKSGQISDLAAEMQVNAAAFKNDTVMMMAMNKDVEGLRKYITDQDKLHEKAETDATKVETMGVKFQAAMDEIKAAKDAGKPLSNQQIIKLMTDVQNTKEPAADKNAPETTQKTDKFGFENSETQAAIKSDQAVDTERRKKQLNMPIYADRIMSSLEEVKPQLDQFKTGGSGSMRLWLAKNANLATFGTTFPDSAVAGDLIDKTLYNVVLDYTNLVQNTGMRGTNLQLQTNIKGKPGPDIMDKANRSIIAELEGNTQDVRLRANTWNAFRQANPLRYADERADDIYEALKTKYPIMTPQQDKAGNTLMVYNPDNVNKIKSLIPDAIAHPEKYDIGDEGINTDPNAGGIQIDFPVPPPKAIAYIKDHPDLKEDFDEKYGKGEADKILGSQ